MGTNLVTLHIGQADPKADRAAEADVLRRTLDEVFGALAEILAAGDAEMAETVAAIDVCREQLAAGGPAEVFEALATECLESTRNVAALARGRATEQAAQIAALVTMVREAVAAITGDQSSLHETLAGSAERFSRLARVNDLHQIQEQLFKEVATLKRLTVEHRAEWQRTSKDLGTRLSTLEKQLDRTRREAAVDPLTNVANRRTFERSCREWLQTHRAGFVMAMVDVDDFKAVNDRCGHAIGDKMLVTVAQTLVASVRSDDLVARLGGDEFAILAAGLTLTQAEGRFGGITRAVHGACRPLVEEGMTASISVGLAEYSAGDTLDSLQQRADTALYQAKKSGKGRVAAKATPLIRDLMKERDARTRK